MIQVVFTKHLLCGCPLRGVPCHLTVFFPWAFFVDIKTWRVEFDNAFEQKTGGGESWTFLLEALVVVISIVKCPD